MGFNRKPGGVRTGRGRFTRGSLRLLEWDPAKHPNDPDGKYTIGGNPKASKSLSGVGSVAGVDISHWKKENSAAKWATKKLSKLEALASAGKWDELQAALYVPKAKPSNQYQKGLVEAQEKLKALAAKATGTKPAANWTKLTGSLGTEVGGKYRDADGVEWYVKTPENVARARNEALAFALYDHAGTPAVESKLVDLDGKVGVATKWMDGNFKANWDNKGDRNSAAEDFAVHAWLGNWDAIGAGSENPMDNIKYDGNGVLRVVDAGGALEYKGMGGSGKKPFTGIADEWETMRNSQINPSAAKVFGGMTSEQLVASSEKLKAVSNDKIAELVDKLGNGTADEKAAMVANLISRKNDIIVRGIQLKNSMPAAHVAQAPAPVDVSVATPIAKPSIPAPPQVPKSASSYQSTINDIHSAAMSGDVAAVESIKTNSTSSQTYAKKTHKYKMAVLAAMGNGATAASTPAPKVAPKAAPAPVVKIDPGKFPSPPSFESGNAEQVAANKAAVAASLQLAQAGDLDGLKAVALTPSPKVQAFHGQLVTNLYNQLNPPPQKLAAAFPELVAKIKSLPKTSKEKAGYWAVLGSTDVPATDPGGEWLSKDQQKDLFAQGKAAWSSITPPPPNGQEYLKTYTMSDYHSINEHLRGISKSGETKAKAAAGALMKAAVPIAEGTKLSRHYIASDNDIKALKPGHVVADGGILSTATTTETWGGNVSWVMTAGPGVRGLPADDFSYNKGEREVLLPPNSRMLITDVSVVKAKNGTLKTSVKAIILPFDDGQWP